MSTQQLQLVCDNSTLANYQQWARPISDWFRTLGFTATADTGQIYPGNAVSVPGSGAYHYEIFKSPNTPYYYIKMMYGNVSGTNCPSLQIGIGTTTNGAGTLTGYVIGPQKVNVQSYTVPSSSTQYECNFCGSGDNYVGVMMWRNGINNCQQLFAIERSLDSSGSYTSSYVTLWTCGTNSNAVNYAQQSLVFGIGLGPNLLTSGSNQYIGGWTVRIRNVSPNTLSFNNAIPIETAAPLVGYYDYPCTVVGIAAAGDFSDGVTFTTTLYGATRTYMPAKAGSFSALPYNVNTNGTTCLLMRYD